MGNTVTSGVSRRGFLVTSGTFAGYAMGVEKVLAQAITTNTDGLVAGDQEVAIGDYKMPVYEARPATGTGHPVVLVISEIWGVHEYIRDCTRRLAKAGYCAVAPELFKREGGVGHMTDIQAILKIVLAQKREQTLANHGFYADYRPSYNKAAADDAWGKCTGWFTKYLKA